MATDKPYQEAERKIAEALRTGATKLDLSCDWDADDSERLIDLPELIGQLTQLAELNLSSNQLTALPESIGQLTQLQSLDLSGNQLTALPESLSQLTQLQSLDLSGNQLTPLSESLSQLTQLQSLDLAYNQLTVLPDWLGQLQLQSLDLSGNQLTALPESLGQLQLQSLNLSGNQLTALPESLGQLQLQSLDLSGNQLTALPESLGQLQLQSLNLSGNQLTVLPESLGQLQLQSLNLSGNQLTALPESLGQLQLQSLNLSGNQLTALPKWLGQLTQLQELNLSSNQLAVLPESLGQFTQLQSLDLSRNQLTALPESLGQFTQLQSLDLSRNQLTALPEWLGQLIQLQELNLSSNQLAALPESLGQLSQLQSLDLRGNQLTALPESLGQLSQLRSLDLSDSQLTALPEWLGQLSQLQILSLFGCQLTSLPEAVGSLHELTYLGLNRNQIRQFPASFSKLSKLRTLFIGQQGFGGNPMTEVPPQLQHLSRLQGLYLDGCEIRDLPVWLIQLNELSELSVQENPLNLELAAAYEQGLDAIKAYLQAKAEDQIVLNEAKLILIGEGEVGKSCLLDALRNEPWQKHDSTHGIEIKPVPVTHRDGNGSETEITLNTWDFGGQKVYRPTHQFFFSAPAVYLVVWKPREGPQQGAIEYWINTIKHRAGEDAKVLIVGTHGGPQQRQPDIDLQDLRDKFGADCVVGAFHVNSRPEHYDEANDTWTGERQGMAELIEAIANAAAALPNVGREVATSWNNVLQAVKQRSEADPYIAYEQFEELCELEKVPKVLAKTYAGMLNQLGYVIHYGTDDDLKQFMILKPDWLAKAISFVLDDPTTRELNGLVSHEHLTQLWNNPPYEYEAGYPEELHPLFRRLMERFDISYQVIVDPANSRPPATSLIAQLVDDQPKPLPDWGDHPQPGDEEKQQICQIVERDKDQSANAEGLFYRLIARLHKYSLGREDYDKSVHWQRGLMLDDDYNGRALLRHIGNDVHITVRAAYPEFLLYELTKDVQELIENPDQGWAGLRCEVVVPCIAPCGLNDPGRGRFDVRKLILNKKNDVNKVLCSATDCEQFHSVEALMRNATVIRRSQLSDSDIKQIRHEVQEIVDVKDEKDFQRMQALYRMMSQADEQLAILMQMGLDEARNGPRLFSLTPTDTGFLDNPSWATQKFYLTLWCEHSRKPLPALCEDRSRGSYKLERSREWLENYGPALRTVTKTLGAILPVVAATTKIAIPDDTYKGIEKGLDFGKELFGAALTSSGALAEVSGDDIISDVGHGVAQQAQNAMLRELHALLQERDPSFGGLVRVQNKRREFMWVHPQFEDEY
ncbi:leucine-rich repeat domain-containing protein [Leptolyngbya sp. CCNP1308]|uniref:leucine-rich repeat domain-containing protein n=1 Tax=Leptolyngbya sp. CCNP1308 TaxID=3110255 RepID=UPI002B1EDCF3|nr:leucine-rich repeat domain-containing protein [Leptolyngbya sp. CCNP1308]MEA5448637.1 leucine-rich repeat domain-containing protein [Leptolyngbya sp. CCNP1308]